MHAFTIVSILAAAAMTSAAPSNQERQTTCAPGTGYYQVCSNQWGVTFKGCCPQDACTKGYCPSGGSFPTGNENVNVPHPTTNTNTNTNSNKDKTCPAGTGYYQSCSNGFNGCCKSDACGSSWCPDYKHGTFVPKTAVHARAWSDDPTYCAPGTGQWYVCAKGNFRGCCTTDPCNTGYCPSTPTPAQPPVKPPVKPLENSNDCPSNWYVCSNGFTGCCKTGNPCDSKVKGGYCPSA